MPIQIPADVTIVTLKSEGREMAQRWTEKHAKSVLRGASDLLSARADIAFPLGTCRLVVEEMPPGARADVMDLAGYHFLSAVHKPASGVRVLLVDKVTRPELGGQSRHETRVCFVTYGADVTATSRMLAHEFGHLLELEHIDEVRRAGPGQEREVAARMRNLMYSGALHPAAELTPEQVKRARSSALARRFGGR